MRVRRFLTAILPVAMMLLVCVASSAGGRKNDASQAEKRRAAARHYYLTAAQYSATGRNAEAGELYKKAYSLDTTYAEAALQYGVRRWGMPADTLATPAERGVSKRIAKKFISRYPGDFFPGVFLANVLERGNELEEAVDVLEGVIKADPGNTDVLQHLSALYLDTHRFDDAIDAIDSYQRIEGDDIEILIRKAGMLLAMGDTVAAIRETDKMVAKYPADAQYMIFKGQLYNYINQQDSALATLKKAEKMTKPGYGGGVKLQLADFYREKGDSISYDNMMYEALLAEDLDFEVKNDVMAYYLQSLIQENGDRTRGDKLFEVLRQQYPHEADLLALSARYNAAKQDFPRALEDISYALDMDHTNASYWEQAMLYAIMQDDYAKADNIFRRAENALEKMPIHLYLLAGNNAVMQDKPADAIELYQRAMDENFPGQDLKQKINLQELGKYLNLQNINDLINLYQQAGDAFYKMNEREKAFVNYDNSLELDPDNALTLNNYAFFLIEGNAPIGEEDLNKADEMSMRAVSIMPDNPTYIDTRAWLLYRKGEYQDAREMEERAISLLAEDASGEEKSEYLSHMGDILFMLNDLQGALENWTKALEASPEDELLKKKVTHRTFFYE